MPTKSMPLTCGTKVVHASVIEFIKWKKNRLTYYIQQYVPGLTKAEVDAEIAAALKAWADVANVQFVVAQPGETPDLVFSTGRGSGSDFDGPMGTLAWAQLPPGSDKQLIMKFDEEESWGISSGIRFRNVACHEIGHLLGLEHSTVKTALMAPIYSQNVSTPQRVDDIPRIQGLYGAPMAVPSPSPNPVPIPPVTPTPNGGSMLAFIKAVLPFLKTLARLTPTQTDDQIIAILEGLLGASAAQVAQVHESMVTQKLITGP